MASDTSIWQNERFKELGERWLQRTALLSRYWRYYRAKYDLDTAVNFQSQPGRYVRSMIRNQIKPIFTPLGRAVNLDVSLIPGGWRLSEESEIFQEPVSNILEWSNWDVEGDLLCLWYAAMGEAGIRIVNEGGLVYLAPVSPLTYITTGETRRPSGMMSIEMRGDDEYATWFTAETVERFVNGEPSGWDALPESNPNSLGRVPLVVALKDGGDGTPEPTFADTLTALDQVNQQATHMAEMIYKHVEPQWAAFGTEAEDLVKSGDNVWFFPEGSDIKAILAAVDFQGLLAFVQEIKAEMKESLPELALRELVGVERVAAATIELQMTEPVAKIRRLRRPIDAAVNEALSVCVRRLSGNNQIRVVLDKERPVIGADEMTRLQIKLMKLNLEREMALGEGG